VITLPRIARTPGEGKEELKNAIERFMQNVLKHMPPAKREAVLKEIEKGRAVRFQRSS